ncbi:Trans-aconitate 2-methyltransferase [subsurface metagenome]
MERWLKEGQDRVWRGARVLDIERGWDGKTAQIAKMELTSSLVVGKSVLDVGCGTGDLYRYLKKANKNVKYLGVDQSADMLERARERNPEARFTQRNIYKMKDIPKFDTVVSLDVLHHQSALEPGFSILMKHARKRLIITLHIAGKHYQHKGGRGEIITYHSHKDLEKKFAGIKHTHHRSVGYKWKDLYCFFLG